jgi:diadenylate cyclase
VISSSGFFANIGISEDSDAFTVIVSEESGRVSTTLGGTITQGLSEEALRLSLTNHIIIQ